MPVLEVKNIRKSFDGVQVLKGISFGLEKGKVLSIIGSSGSGKTTLLRCMNFLEHPEEGQILVNGQLLENRLHFGLVFQSFNLFPQYNVLDNCTLAPDLLARDKAKAEGRPFDKAAAHKANVEKAETLLARVGLGAKLKNYTCELSGGQQQRVAIARALALEPDILCFDEPTSALDPELTNEVLRVIKGLKSADTTMVIVTHEMEFARHVSDHVIFMADGVIEEEGDPEQIFTAPKSEKTRSFLAKSLEQV